MLDNIRRENLYYELEFVIDCVFSRSTYAVFCLTNVTVIFNDTFTFVCLIIICIFISSEAGNHDSVCMFVLY